MEIAFTGHELEGVELLLGERLLDLEYADDIALICDSSQACQAALDKLALAVSRFGLCFAPPKCKAFLQDWQGSLPVLTLGGDQLEVVEKFSYLGSCISALGIEDEITNRIAKARSAFANLRHLWRRRDITLALKGRVYNAAVRSTLIYGCETWPLRSADMKRLLTFDHRCLHSLAHIWWEHRVSNERVRRLVYGLGKGNEPLSTVISLTRLRWLGHVLRMPTHRLPRRALFAHRGCGWKKRRGGQAMTWSRGMKALTSELASVGASRLPGWGPKDGEHVWLDTLADMARSRPQWRSCCIHLKILREDSKYPGSSKVVYWLRGCFDAIDRQYLLLYFLEANQMPVTLCNLIPLVKLSNLTTSRCSILLLLFFLRPNILSRSEDESVKTATLNLLKTIRTAGEKLRSLPPNIYMTMRLQYHENTPEDYKPPGFRDAENISFDFEGSPVNIRIGNVQTVLSTISKQVHLAIYSDKSLKMHMQVNRFFLNTLKRPDGDLTSPADTSQHLVEMTTQGLTTQAEKQNEDEELASCIQKQTLQSDDNEDEIYDVRCPCGVHKDDGVMIVCDGCGMWQHAVCFRILEESDVPTSHICEHCSESR
ncbi:unnamed protein product [Dicrocoelium dendriticum]|nr:unnamed protein product [Dicrocoelium dendriticum]